MCPNQSRQADRPWNGLRKAERTHPRRGAAPRLVLGALAIGMLIAGAVTIWFAQYLAARNRQAPVEVRKVGEAPYLKAPPTNPDELLKDFTLTERSGQKFHSAEMKGTVWVTCFFFSRCPGSCRQQSELMRDLHAKYGRQGVRFASITCDPKHDSPATLREYAERLTAHPRQWLFLTGDLTYIRRIGAEYFGVFVQEQTHMDRLVIRDKWGVNRGRYRWKDEAELKKLHALLPQLLAETEPPPEKKPEPRPNPEDDPNFDGRIPTSS